jgi:hypothetical protein
MSRLTFRSLITALALFVLFCVPSIASADGITWGLSGVFFDDGGTASGSFVYDAITNTYSSINVTTTTGTTMAGATYSTLSYLGTSSNTGLLFGASSGDLTGTSLLFWLFNVPLTNSGGIVQLSTLPPNDSIEAFCTSSDCSNFSTRSVTGGQVVSTVATPEPPVISLLGMGLFVLLISAALRKVSHA